MKKINLKYSERALFPVSLTAGDSRYEEYTLSGGEVVRFRYIMTCINDDCSYDEMLDRLCVDLYGMSFPRVRSIWASRLRGVSPTRWHLVEMKNPNEIREEIEVKTSSKRKRNYSL